MALAAGPLSTSIRSTSSAAMSASEPRLMEPSMITSGSWFPAMAEAPRSRSRMSEPGSPEGWITRTPAMRPRNPPRIDVAMTSPSSLADRVPMAEESERWPVVSFGTPGPA
jgi:hypothetical protein